MSDNPPTIIPSAEIPQGPPEPGRGSYLPLGELLLQAGLITGDQLQQALDEQARSGERIGHILVGHGGINRLALGQTLARQLDLPFYNLLQDPPSHSLMTMLSEPTARRLEAVPVATDGEAVIVAFTDPLDSAALAEVERELGRPVRPAVTSEYDVQWILEHTYRTEYTEKCTRELSYRQPEDSASETFTLAQLVVLAGILAAIFVGLLMRPQATLTLLNGLLTLFYVAVSGYRLYLLLRGATYNLVIHTPPEAVEALQDRDLPVYTVLVPLYREKEVLPTLLQAIARLNYPHTKLDVKLLFEENDAETYEAAKALRPPAHFKFVVVPDCQPRTKPKACNYGLIQATGEFCVIYDAEDIPEPDQLRKAVVAFRRAPQEMVCLQSKLNYYNRDQNLLTRWFTIEYSMWFDLFLPGLDAVGVPIPLGGTSNHFRTEPLRQVGAWDPFNVTEDCDLGLRLHKAGYRTAVIDSTTYEEANSEAWNWTRQRTRWLKGYIQTWLVHMRRPVQLLRTVGLKSFLSMQLTVGGVPFATLINPIYWALTLAWFLSGWEVVPLFFPPLIYYAGAVCLFVGNFVFMYANVAGCLMRGYHELVRYALISPLYWGMMSLAGWRALYQLLLKPFVWEKTTHGLHLKAKGNPVPFAPKP